jgi:lactate dehydrogenase-like 2-hydroxyacid dehydrogenase
MQPCDRSWLLENAKGATGILVMLTDKVDEELLEAAGPQLKAIASFSVGTDHVDRDALKKRNIRLGYTPTCLTDAVADLTIMLILMAQRRMASDAVAPAAHDGSANPRLDGRISRFRKNRTSFAAKTLTIRYQARYLSHV